MVNYWISWYHFPKMGEFIFNPWWITGNTGDGHTICAAVRAISPEAAKEKIVRAYKERPEPYSITFRFVEMRDRNWSPFSERFPKADWMEW